MDPTVTATASTNTEPTSRHEHSTEDVSLQSTMSTSRTLPPTTINIYSTTDSSLTDAMTPGISQTTTMPALGTTAMEEPDDNGEGTPCQDNPNYR